MKTTTLVIILCTVALIVGILIGYMIGYQHGAKAMVNYAVTIVDKIKIDKFNVEINQTKMDKLFEELENMTDELNKRLNNITLP